MTLTLDIATDLEHQILQEARRRGLDAERFVIDLLREFLANKAAASTLTERDLLEEINRGFAPEVWRRYRELVAKRQSERLSAEEQTELIALIDQVEVANAHRMKCLAELATRRQVPLRSLMTELGIQPAADA